MKLLNTLTSLVTAGIGFIACQSAFMMLAGPAFPVLNAVLVIAFCLFFGNSMAPGQKIVD